MADWTEVLDALALCEEHLATLGREREQLPRSIDETEQEAEDARRRLEGEREAFAEFERSRRDQESELQDCEARTIGTARKPPRSRRTKSTPRCSTRLRR